MDPARILLDRYRLEGLLGQGGMGVVHRGTDLSLERPVAIKLVRPDPAGTDARVERFAREAKRTAQLRHPGIVEVFDTGQTADGETFLVMELLEGQPLSAHIREGLIKE